MFTLTFQDHQSSTQYSLATCSQSVIQAKVLYYIRAVKLTC